YHRNSKIGEINVIRSVYFHQKLFMAMFSLAAILLFSHCISFLYIPAWILAAVLLVLILMCILTLYTKPGTMARRNVPEKLSNSDHNPIGVSICNGFPFRIKVEVIDELPIQFQKRDFLRQVIVDAGQSAQLEYSVRPVQRGVYTFGK